MVRIPNNSLPWDMPVSPLSSWTGGITRALIVFPACFLGALQFVARKSGKKDAAANAKIHSSVILGQSAEMDGFALKVDLKIEGIEDEALIKAAHEVVLSGLPSLCSPLTHTFVQFCPYSRALKHGIEVNVGKA